MRCSAAGCFNGFTMTRLGTHAGKCGFDPIVSTTSHELFKEKTTMHDSERPLIYAKLPRGRTLDDAFGPGTTEQPSRYTGPLVYAPVENYGREAIEKTGREIGSHTVPNAPV